MADSKLENVGLSRTTKDLISGAAGGIAQVLIGQPFDIVKVRLQTTSIYPSALNCATTILKNEGPLSFYKGTLTPLIGVGACVSVQFGGFHFARRWFEERNAQSRGLGASSRLTYGQYYASGAFAGISNTILSTPIEHVRIRLQAQPHGAGRYYNGPLDCIRKLSGHGVGRGLYRGTGVTLLREIQGYGIWFMAFEFLMDQDVKRNNYARSDVATLKVALYGGLAGEALWLASYPLDVIKSKIQTDPFGKDRKFKSAIDCARQVMAQSGIGGFWRGIGPTLFRAMPVSAGTFAVAELTMKALG